MTITSTSASGFGGDDKCKYESVSAKSTTGFTLTNRTCKDGTATPVSAAFSFDYIATPFQ